MPNTPYLVGNTYKRDHIFGLTVTKAEWIAAGVASGDVRWAWPPSSTGTVPARFPVAITLQQLMVCAWQVRRWNYSGSGLHLVSHFDGDPGTLEAWTRNTDLIHSQTSSPYVEDKKAFLLRGVFDLRNNVGRGYLDNWDVEGHLPFFFNGPSIQGDSVHGNFLSPVTAGQGQPLLINYEGGDGFTPFHRIPVFIYDEDAERFYPYFRDSTPGGFTGPPASVLPPLNTFGFHCGDLTITADGMDDIVIPYYNGQAGAGPTSDMVMAATEYW